MPFEPGSKSAEIFEQENSLMDLHLPEEIKSRLMRILHNERLAAQIFVDYELPDLSSCGLVAGVIEFDVDPITAEMRKKIAEMGIKLPQEELESRKNYLYFIAKEPSVVQLLESAFNRKDYALIEKITNSGISIVKN